MLDKYIQSKSCLKRIVFVDYRNFFLTLNY